jgi:hypothetical protein
LSSEITRKDLKPLKTQTGRFYACPVSVITENTRSIMDLVNNTTDIDCNILHMPFPGSYLEQPKWYRDSVNIIRNERDKKREADRIKAAAKAARGNNGR